MEAATTRPDLRLVDTSTGEVSELPDELEKLRQQLAEAESELRAKRSQITLLKNENAALRAIEPDHDDILGVMTFWRSRLVPGASVTTSAKGWKTVRKLLREVDEESGKPRFTPLHLKAAVAGMALDEYTMDRRYRHRRYLENALSDPGKVDRLIEGAVSFKRRNGVSALTLLDELGAPALSFLADRCSCGGLRMAHLMGAGCPSFDEFAAKVERHLAGEAA